MSAKFDTLKFSQTLEASGLAPNLTKKLASLLHDDVLEAIATKQDLKDLDRSLEAKLAQLELRLTVRMGAILMAGIAIVVAIETLLR